MNNFVLAITTTPEKDAVRISKALVESKFCACINIISNVTSIYHWKGNVETDTESILLIKTEKEFIELIEAKLKEVHPYELPELIVLPIDWGKSEYLDWISEWIRKS
jgi:periplasmic divalent cation tolerance protein